MSHFYLDGIFRVTTTNSAALVQESDPEVIKYSNSSKLILTLSSFGSHILLSIGGIRRINFSRLWSSATQTASYDKLTALAREYSSSDDIEADVTITYLDEDGDTITISSDEELGEAFLQFVDKVPPVLRASAAVKCSKKQKPEAKVEQPKKDKKGKTEQEDQPKESEDTKPSPASFVAPGDEHTRPTLRNSGPTNGANVPSPEPLQQVEVILKGVASVLGSVVSSFNQQANANKGDSATANRDSPTVDTGTEEAERFVREVISNVQMAGSTSTANTGNTGATATTAPTDNVGLTGFDSTFIHGFHTCDGCAKKPIVGYRFHATNRPDYDLCMNCHADEAKCRDAEGVISFEPSELGKYAYIIYRPP